MTTEVGSRIAKNSLYNMLRTFLTIPIVLFLTPYIIRTVGKEEFGVWALIGVITSYAQLSDFGVTESLIKYFAESSARKDSDETNALINTALVIYASLCVLCGTCFVAILPMAVDKIFNIPDVLRDKALNLFFIAIFLFFVNMMMGVFGSLIVGMQRMGYSNLIAFFSAIITSGGTFLFLHFGFGLSGLVYSSAITTLFVSVANVWGAKHLFPEMSVNPVRYFRKDYLGRIFGFSWKIFVSGLTGLMIFQMDRVLISHFIGLGAVASYEVANRITSQARGLIASVFSPMVPAASVLQAADNQEKVSGLYRRSFKYMALVAVPFSFLIIGLAHPFVRTWMGPGYGTSALTMQFLAFANLINILTAPGSFILSGISLPQIGMKSSIVAGITNLLLCLALIRWIGYYGVIIGIMVTFVVSGVYFLTMLHQNIAGLTWKLYPASLARPVCISLLLCILSIMLDRVIPLNGYVTLMFVAAVYTGLVVAVMWRGTYLDGFDRLTLIRICPKFLRGRAGVKE